MFLFRKRSLRLTAILAVVLIMGLGGILSPGIRHSHDHGEDSHTHDHGHSHGHSHAHGSHTHSHAKGHGHSHSHGHSHCHSHTHDHPQKDDQVQAESTPHVHFRLFGFEFTFVDYSDSDESALAGVVSRAGGTNNDAAPYAWLTSPRLWNEILRWSQSLNLMAPPSVAALRFSLPPAWAQSRRSSLRGIDRAEPPIPPPRMARAI